MAGIGFELRKLMHRDTYIGTLQAYGYAGLISSGPWVLSILGILILGFISTHGQSERLFISQFQTSVTYLIAGSLILSGSLQLAFTRFIADELFFDRDEVVIPSFHTALFVMTLFSGCIATIAVTWGMPQQDVLYRVLMSSGFVILSNIWVATTLLSGLKAYRAILWVFAIAYALVVGQGYWLQDFGLNGLLFAFVSGHLLLLCGLCVVLYRGYPTHYLLDFRFLKPGKLYYSLVLSGIFYNLGVWVDKLIFWFHPATSVAIIGPLRASLIYDLPIFLAYLSIIPGMAVFLVRMETEFVEYYDKFYNAVRDGGTLSQIRQYRNEMVMIGRQGIFEIIKIQGIAVLTVFVSGTALLKFLHISPLYYHLLCVDVVGTGLQVVLLGVLNVFFYLDKRERVLKLTLLFVILNAVLSYISIQLGAFYFGYGFTVALLMVIAVAMHQLNTDFENLEFETFMLQPA